MAGTLDFALVNPVTAIEAIDSGTAVPIATLKVHGLPYFAGAIIARRDRHISSLADLKGKDVLAYQKSSAGAYIFQLYHLAKNGIDPFKDLKSLRQGNNQENIVLAVHAGRIDAGFVRSGILELLAANGRINPDDLVVVDERHDDLKYRHTTELYPERFLLVSTKLEDYLSNRLQQAALALGGNDPASRAAGIDGFVKPLGLEKVREAMRVLQVQLAPDFTSSRQ
jgi:ABC-type phosphate/phosphonate transport system substrate-binding protein